MFSATIATNRIVLCPHCGCTLDAANIMFIDSTGFCFPCSRVDYIHLALDVSLCMHAQLREDVVKRQGLLMFAPLRAKNVTASQLYLFLHHRQIDATSGPLTTV